MLCHVCHSKALRRLCSVNLFPLVQVPGILGSSPLIRQRVYTSQRNPTTPYAMPHAAKIQNAMTMGTALFTLGKGRQPNKIAYKYKMVQPHGSLARQFAFKMLDMC